MPPRLSVKEALDELDERQNPVSVSGSVKIGGLIVSAHGIQGENGQHKILSPEHISVSDHGQLGRGSSGSVRRVRNTETNSFMALKEIKISNDAHLKEIQRELQALHTPDAILSPYLVDFFGAYAAEGSVFIAMECMTGSLAQLPTMPDEVLASVTADLLEGCHYLHKIRHLVHRDIKPGNCLFNADGVVKISDFGLSSQLESTLGNTSSFVGTVQYMSPERLTGEPYSTPGDIWSVGISVAELVMGVHPYSDMRQNSSGQQALFWKLVQHVNDGSKPLLDLPEDASDEVKSFIFDCITKDATKRPSAADLLNHPFLVKYCGPRESRTLSPSPLRKRVGEWLVAAKAMGRRSSSAAPSANGLEAQQSVNNVQPVLQGSQKAQVEDALSKLIEL